MFPRIEKMRTHIDELNDAGIRKNLFYELAAQSLAVTSGQSIQRRRALAQAHILENAPIEVHPYELLTGTMTGLCPVVPALCDEDAHRRAREIIETYLQKKAEDSSPLLDRNCVKTFEEDFISKESRWSLMSRVYHDGNVTYETLQQLIRKMHDEFADTGIDRYVIGRELERNMKLPFGDGVKARVDALPWFAANHLSLNYARIARTGIGPLCAEIATKLKDSDLSPDQREYYECAQITAQAMGTFMRRTVAALETASRNTSEPRADELLQMAEICRNITSEPAKTFREALQFIWLLHIMASMCSSSALSFARFDQYMWNWYDRDIRDGRLTRTQAEELLCCFWLKINEPKLRTVQSLTLGGIHPDGTNAVNDLTYLCLDVTARMHLPYPNIGLRINHSNPADLYDSAIASIRSGSGQPMILNDDVWIENLQRLGYAPEVANDYYNMGCVEIMVPNVQPNWGVTDPVAFPMLFADVFAKVKADPDSFSTYAAFRGAYMEALERAVQADRTEADSKANQMSNRCYDPLASLMIDGCLETGRDMFQGGSRLGTHWSFYAYGLGTAADALCAVKKHVYDDGSMQLKDLTQALEANFAGAQPLRTQLMKATPHYGNDEDEVDAIARDILSTYTDLVMNMNTPARRDKYVTTLFGYFFHVYHGEITGATPDGRRKGEPFSDSMGPAQGRDTNGPTCLLNSVLKLDHRHVTGGYALSFKISPSTLRTTSGAAALGSLFRAYVRAGGPQLQGYLVGTEDLRDARIHPERHRNLIVRVGGYCEYFVNLDAALQEEIIDRTVQGLD